jgi:hypothetical protein
MAFPWEKVVAAGIIINDRVKQKQHRQKRSQILCLDCSKSCCVGLSAAKQRSSRQSMGSEAASDDKAVRAAAEDIDSEADNSQ